MDSVDFSNVPKSVSDRLSKYIRINYVTGCHEWTGLISEKGYGRICINKKMAKVHRVMMGLKTKQQIPKGMVVMHKCNHPCCCNPEHLQIGTQKENVADSVAIGTHVTCWRWTTGIKPKTK